MDNAAKPPRGQTSLASRFVDRHDAPDLERSCQLRICCIGSMFYRLMQNLKLRLDDLHCLGLLGRAYAEREHAWSRTFDRLFAVYRSIAN